MRQSALTEQALSILQRHDVRVSVGVLFEEFAQTRLILGKKKLDPGLVELLRAERLSIDLHACVVGPELRLYVQEESLLFRRLGMEEGQGEAQVNFEHESTIDDIRNFSG